jgi:hypothetical protein
MISTALTIFLIACHGGPADHFAVFAKHLKTVGHDVHVCASGPALKKFQDHQVPIDVSFNADGLSPETEAKTALSIANECKNAHVVIADVGHTFDITLQKTLSEKAPKALRIAYYDNPESYVPGGYSTTAAEVMQAADRVLFANNNAFANPIYVSPGKTITLEANKRFCLGYYPTAQADAMHTRRSIEQKTQRELFFAKHGIQGEGKTIAVYCGGNNKTYFEQAFPAFLAMLESSIHTTDLSHLVIILQQHPGAKSLNYDGQTLDAWLNRHKSPFAPQCIISNQPTDDMLTIADTVLYYQTSMGPFFVIAGIPAIQVGHEVYDDILVRNKLCKTATNPTELIAALQSISLLEQKELDSTLILNALGIQSDWEKNLDNALEAEIPNTQIITYILITMIGCISVWCLVKYIR